jgi:hypothetical protein
VGCKRTKDRRDETHRHTAGYGLLNHRRNEDILEELTADSFKMKL